MKHMPTKFVPPVTGGVPSVGASYGTGWLFDLGAPFPRRLAPGGLFCPRLVWNGVFFPVLPLLCAVEVGLFTAAISSPVPFARPILFFFLFLPISD